MLVSPRQKELFDHAPEIRDELFADKPTEVLAVKLGVILHEVVRLLSIDSPRELAGVIAEMGLKHIEYGLEAKHVQPFITVMLATIKMKLTEKGFKWMAKNKRAWSWALKEVTTLLINAVDGGRPKINILKRSAPALPSCKPCSLSPLFPTPCLPSRFPRPFLAPRGCTRLRSPFFIIHGRCAPPAPGCFKARTPC